MGFDRQLRAASAAAEVAWLEQHVARSPGTPVPSAADVAYVLFTRVAEDNALLTRHNATLAERERQVRGQRDDATAAMRRMRRDHGWNLIIAVLAGSLLAAVVLSAWGGQ